jgi:FAD/FMN-containing dehydrogenase
MTQSMTIRGFAGEIVEPGDATYDSHREVWNAMVDRRPRLIARCTSAEDVAAAIRYGRDAGLEIAVKCGGHSVLGLSIPEDGLMIDLTPMGGVRGCRVVRCYAPSTRRQTCMAWRRRRATCRIPASAGSPLAAGWVGSPASSGWHATTSSPTRS